MQRSQQVWDPLVRLFHWSLVGCFAGAYVSGEAEHGSHEWFGYVAAGLVLLRILWGFVGTRHARFSDFVFGPATLWAYVRSLFSAHPRYYRGHNPLGGWMVLALMLMVLAVSASGLAAQAPAGQDGWAQWSSMSEAHADDDYARRDRDEEHEDEEHEREGDERWEEAHEFLAHLGLWLIALHVLGVLIASHLHRENLIRAMLSGCKPPPPDASPSGGEK